MKTRLIIIRHGQTDWNAQKRIQGSIERPLNEEGRQQAREVGKKFSDHTIAAIYSSTMHRARETAEIIGEFHDCEIRFDVSLREITYGEVEGMTVVDYRHKYAKELEERNLLPFEEWLHYKVVPGAESPAEIVDRVLPTLKSICAAHPGENVIVVSHGFVIRTLMACLGDFSARELQIGNTGLIHLEGDASELKFLSYEGAV